MYACLDECGRFAHDADLTAQFEIEHAEYGPPLLQSPQPPPMSHHHHHHHHQEEEEEEAPPLEGAAKEDKPLSQQVRLETSDLVKRVLRALRIWINKVGETQMHPTQPGRGAGATIWTESAWACLSCSTGTPMLFLRGGDKNAFLHPPQLSD
jgi:hypothetical protein